jgi:ubiquitin-like protein Pup
MADHVVRKFVLNWYDEDRTRAVELLGQLDRLGLQRLARVPFSLTMLCVLHDTPQQLPGTTTEILKAMSRRILQGDWTPEPRPAETIDGCIELGARLAWYFSTETGEWRDQIEVAEALRAIDAICREKPALRKLPQSEPWETWALAQMNVLGGLLSIPLSDDSTSLGRVSFTHKAFHEFLTALYMARHAEEEGMRHLTRVWWIDPDWIDVIPHVVALSPSPEKWVNIIAGDQPDTLCTCTIMALRGIVLASHSVRAPEFEEVVARSVRLLADLQIVAPGSRVANRLRDALDYLPIGWRNTLQSGGVITEPHSRISKHDFEVDEILDDEIDEVLEENAEEFVRSYVDSFPFSRVRVAHDDERGELDVFVKREWLRLYPLSIRGNLPGPVSCDSPWSISDFVQICRARERSDEWWLQDWTDAISQAISQGEIAVTIPVLSGLLLAANHEFYELADYVLARERWLMSDTLIEECSRVIGPMGRVAAATALRCCESATSATVIRGLLADPDQSVQDAALAAISSTHSQPLIDLLEPLVIEGVPGVRRAVERYLRDADSCSVSSAALMAIANDIDAKVRVTALSRLVRNAGEGDEQWVAGLLEDETDPQVRAAAIWSMDALEHTWTADLAQRGYLSNRTDVSRAAWADIAVAHASRLTTGGVLREIASDQAVRLTLRLDAVKAMWHRGMESDVADIAVLATSYGQERENSRWHITLPNSNRFPWHSSLPWRISDSENMSRSDVELLCVLLERAQVRDPFNHPLWRAMDELLPSLGLILRDFELRGRLRLALDRFEHWPIADPQL